jgi:hypothetical protein
MDKDARVCVAGHRGLVGSAITGRLRIAGHEDLLTAGAEALNLRDQAAVNYGFRADSRKTCSSWRARSAASWPTRLARRNSSTTT